MRKILVVLSVFFAVSGFSSLASAGAMLEDLCGTTLTSNTEVKHTNESFAGPCTITIATGRSLEIRYSTIDVTSGNLTIIGEGSASLEIKDNDYSDDDIKVANDFLIDFETGAVEIKSNDIDVGGDFDIMTTSGPIEVKSNSSGTGTTNKYVPTQP